MKNCFEKVAIIGVGLIGGSLALALKKEGLADSLVGIDRDRDQIHQAIARGAVDTATTNVLEGVTGADLVVLAVPVNSCDAIIREGARALSEGCIVTDVGSTKSFLIRQMEQSLPASVFFVGAHPIAGREKSGIEAASGDLFRGSRCILTPTDRTNGIALKRVEMMWQKVGSEPVLMDPEHHDQLFAAISHLPHMIAYALVNTVEELLRPNAEMLSFSAGGFKDFTRIAASSPEMWRDICLHNKENILASIQAYEGILERIKGHIRSENGARLYQEFEQAKRLRERLA